MVSMLLSRAMSPNFQSWLLGPFDNEHIRFPADPEKEIRPSQQIARFSSFSLSLHYGSLVLSLPSSYSTVQYPESTLISTSYLGLTREASFSNLSTFLKTTFTSPAHSRLLSHCPKAFSPALSPSSFGRHSPIFQLSPPVPRLSLVSLPSVQ